MSITIEADKAWFWSDTHFFHKAAAKARGYADVHAMNEALLSRCKVLSTKDTLFLLGDVSFGKFQETFSLLSHIPARIILFRGNHDDGLSKHLETMFEEVHTRATVKVVQDTGPKGHTKREVLARIICDHHPILSWKDMHLGTWHLHGHSHGSLKWPGFQEGKVLDVGVDAFGWEGPVPFWKIQHEMDVRPIVSYDHHKPHMEEKGDWTL